MSASRRLLEALDDQQRELWAQASLRQRRDAMRQIFKRVEKVGGATARQLGNIEYELRDAASEDSPSLALKIVKDVVGRFGIDETFFWKAVRANVTPVAA